jgi:hypothetical protein
MALEVNEVGAKYVLNVKILIDVKNESINISTMTWNCSYFYCFMSNFGVDNIIYKELLWYV